MTLEDFFTLTERKDGLSTLGRVEELVSAIQQQKDCSISNTSDAARQWSTIANTLAITANVDCLHHFIQLNGLCFFSQWLQEAQKSDNESTDNAAEEMIEALLTSLERFPVDMEKSYFPEIRATVGQLLNHRSPNIKERAGILFGTWNYGMDIDASHHNVESAQTCKNAPLDPSVDQDVIEQGLHSNHPVRDISSSGGNNGKGCYDDKSERSESHDSNVTFCSEKTQMETTKDVIASNANLTTPATSLSLTDANAHLASSFEEILPMVEETSVCPSVGTTSSCSFPNGGNRTDAIDQNDVSVCKEDADVANEMDASVCKEDADVANEMDVSVREEDVNNAKKMDLDTEEASQNDISKDASYRAQSVSALVTAGMEPDACNSDDRHNESCISERSDPQQKSDGIDCGMVKHAKTINEFNLLSGCTEGFQDLSSNGYIIRNKDDIEASCNRKEAVGSVNNIEELGDEDDEATAEDFQLVRDSPKAMETKEFDMDQKSELELDEEFDPLAVARQVAVEVEREVVDYREPFCSSPEANSGETYETCSPDFVRNMQDEPANEALKENRVSIGKDLHNLGLSPKQEISRISENVVIDREGCEVGKTQNSSLVAQETPGNLEKNRYHFDLNEDACEEEFSCAPNVSVHLSDPIAAAATKGAPGFQVVPFHFEQELQWKGSADVGASQPTSPCRIADVEKTSASKQKVNLLDIDLNVAGSEDLEVDPVKQAHISSGFLSSNHSMEFCSRRAERLKLDLNHVGDDDVPPQRPLHSRYNHLHGCDVCLPPASSSSSRQPSARDFDLNDSPSFLNADSSHTPNNGPFTSRINGISKIDDPEIMIMSSRMVVARKEYSSQGQQYFMANGLSMDSAMAYTPVQPYAFAVPAAYLYNRFAPSTAMPISPTPYGPRNVQSLVDAGGTSIPGGATVPQVRGQPVLNSASSARPSSFLTSVTSISSGINGGGSLQLGLDLNTALTSETGSKFPLEEQDANPSLSASSGMPAKRKEPDSGWESYPLGYKKLMWWL